MENFIKLGNTDKLNIFNQTSERSGLSSSAIEKDWWVTLSFNELITRIKELNSRVKKYNYEWTTN